MNIRPFEIKEEDAVIQLWTDCGLVRSWNNPNKDIACKLTVNPEWFLVGAIDHTIMASVMAGYDGHRGWIYYLAVHPDFQKNGYGQQIMQAAEKMLKEAGCPKINLQVRTSNTKMVKFYERIGFAMDDVVSMGKRL